MARQALGPPPRNPSASPLASLRPMPVTYSVGPRIAPPDPSVASAGRSATDPGPPAYPVVGGLPRPNQSGRGDGVVPSQSQEG